MNAWKLLLGGMLGLTITSMALAALPEPPKQMAPWAMPWGDDVPGAVAADALLVKPAGKNGPVVARDGHFYSGNQRVRFWGFSIAFSGAFPSHEQADEVARRLAHFGVNAIRFHHIDNQPYPNGIFTDRTLETLSPEALDRLDYFVAALKSQGIYSDLNLHVSRWWSKAHHWENADKLPEYDKMVDLFDPKLISAQKQYARDLLTHVNPYTHTRYADEPAVCFLEINNENTLFLWGGEQKLAELPEPYGAELTKLWNEWLVKKYGERAAMKAAWSAGVQPAGPNLLKPFTAKPPAWRLEQHDTAKAAVAPNAGDAEHAGVRVTVSSSDGTGWHVQLSQAGLKVASGRGYSFSFDARADEPTTVEVALSQAHAPWRGLGAAFPVRIGREWKHYHFGVYCTGDDDNARVCFQLGAKAGTIDLSNVAFTVGGQQILASEEDPSRGTVARGYPDQGFTPARLRDWYDFLQQTDQSYFTGMMRFLKEDLGVKCPITGTIGLGPLGTLSQSHTDFVDAHAYWDHPNFPHRAWDGADWVEKNQPMVDDPGGATLWQLAATRVAGKPFTVTEYNHAAPNEWQAECIPMIAAYAALQDWDGVFLFDYVASSHYREMDRMRNYFDFEGNPQKMDLMPFGARLFVGEAIKPLPGRKLVSASRRQMLETGSKYYYTTWPFVRDVLHVAPQDALGCRLELTFGQQGNAESCVPDPRVSWTSAGVDTGTGRFIVRGPNAAVFVGFAGGSMPIDLGPARIEKLQTPFATIIVTPAKAGEPIDRAKRLLISAVARGGNAGMRWDAARHTVSNHWGDAPPLVEVVHGTVGIATSTGSWKAFALKPDGTRGEPVPVRMEPGRATLELGTANTLWYELDRD